MEIHLRMILFLVGIIIFAVVVIDVFKQKKQRNIFSNREQLKSVAEYESRQGELDFGKEFNSKNWDNYRDNKTHNNNDRFLITNDNTTKNEVVTNDLIALFVMARETQGFAGDHLKRILETAYLVYGKMKIFHRLSDDEQKNVLFSVASAMEPGTFDLQQLATQFIPGLTIFMLPSKVMEPSKVFDSLVRTAKQLAFSLNGELRDQYHNPLTLQIIEKYKHKLKAYFVCD